MPNTATAVFHIRSRKRIGRCHLNALISKLIAFWHSLNPVAQGAITMILGTAFGAVAHAIETPGACVTWQCLFTDAKHGLHTGIAAAIALYVTPNLKSNTNGDKK